MQFTDTTQARDGVNKMRTEVTERVLYSFEELSEASKERAREWWRAGAGCDNFFAEAVIDDAEHIAPLLGIDFMVDRVPLCGGGTRTKPRIYWSGFWSQGDGASFEAYFAYKKGSAKAIREHAPMDKELHAIADALQAAQRRVFYRANGTITTRGHYSHSGTMHISMNDGCESVEDDIEQALREFADWIYSQLEAAYEYEQSDENVDANIIANGYEFTEAGDLA